MQQFYINFKSSALFYNETLHVRIPVYQVAH